MLSRFMLLFGFFALVLVAVYWVNRAVILFDQLIADGHSAGIVLEFTALSLPSVILMVLPMAAFAATVFITNRLATESELVVAQSMGFSPWRLARPALFFGIIVALLMSVLSHFLVPESRAQLKKREQEISSSVSARLLRAGAFLTPSPGLTFYIREITAEGELRDVYLSDRRQEGRAVTYTAERAFVLRDATETRLVMLNGLAQTLDLETNRLSTTSFEDLTYDVSGLIAAEQAARQKPDMLPTWVLLTQTNAVAEAAKDRPAEVLEEAHSRFQEPLLAIVAALIGYATLMVGGFSRFGKGKQIVGAIFLLVVVKFVESAVTGPVTQTATLWPLVYLPSVVGFAIVGVLLHIASRPLRRSRNRHAEAEAPA